MKIISPLLMYILLLTGPTLRAQDFKSQEEKEVFEIFELFFESMWKRDTIALKKIIHFSGTYPSFFKLTSGNDQRLSGRSGSSVKGFLKTVGNENGRWGKCRNEFENIAINVYQRYAILTCNYKCYVDNNVPENFGMYTLQFLRQDQWKIERVFRYNKIENENYPTSILTNDKFECRAINFSFEIPENWEIMSIEYRSIWDIGDYRSRTVNDSLKVNAKVLIGILKKGERERIVIYITEPKYPIEQFAGLAEKYRLQERNKIQATIEIKRNSRWNDYTFESKKQTIFNVDFLVTSLQKSFDEDIVVENLSFDANINNHLLLIEGLILDQESKEEVISIVNGLKFHN